MNITDRIKELDTLEKDFKEAVGKAKVIIAKTSSIPEMEGIVNVDAVISAFLADTVKVNPRGYIPKTKLYNLYFDWCFDNGFKAHARHGFNNVMWQTGYVYEKIVGVKVAEKEFKSVRSWAGIELINQEEKC